MKEMITEEKIKRDMMELWKDTFHDSSRYIRLVFDTYFTPESFIVRYDENRLIASLLSVPYEFQILAKGGEKRILKGLYLCGLATRPEFRRQGIMSEMMRDAERKAKENGYDFTFLIPADTHLREYYRRNGYVDSSFRTTERLMKEAGSEDKSLHIYSVKDLLESGHLSLIEDLADWCREREKDDLSYPTIIHSRKDMVAVLTENENSIFLTEEPFDLENPILTKIIAVAFPEINKEDDGVEKVVLAGLFIKTEEGCASRVGKSISDYYSCNPVELRKPYEELLTEIRGVTPYAMVKSLNTNENSEEIENMKYKIYLMLD